MGRLPYEETGRTFCGLTATSQNSFLSKVLLQVFCEEDKEVFITNCNGVLSTQLLQDLHTLASCSYEEADSHLLLHVSQHGHHQILIRTVDTDNVVLVVFAKSQLPAGCGLWLAFGTGKSFRYLAAHQRVACLGPEMSRPFPMFQALTGCNTVSRFSGHGKKAEWSTWKSVLELTDALLMLANGPKEIPDDAVNIERFVILLFDRTSTCTKARRKLFPWTNLAQ